MGDNLPPLHCHAISDEKYEDVSEQVGCAFHELVYNSALVYNSFMHTRITASCTKL